MVQLIHDKMLVIGIYLNGFNQIQHIFRNKVFCNFFAYVLMLTGKSHVLYILYMSLNNAVCNLV